MVYQSGFNELKSLMISFLLHGVIIGFYFIFLHSKSISMMQESHTMVIEMSLFEKPGVIEPSALPQESVPEIPPRPIEELKPIEKIPEKSKPIIKKEPVVKPVPRKESTSTIIPTTEIESVSSDAVESNVETASTSSSQPITLTQKGEGGGSRVKTDFEIIRDKVLSYLVYPSIAKRMNWNGVVQVALVIDSNGHLVSAAIHQSSGRDILDNAALETANRLKGQQLPKPQITSTVILPIAFKLR